MLRSQPWKSLSNAARVAFLHLKLNENGDPAKLLHLPYSQGIELMAKATLTRALRELQEAGFVELVEPGGLFAGAAGYKLLTRWQGSDTASTRSRRRGQAGKRQGSKLTPDRG